MDLLSKLDRWVQLQWLKRGLWAWSLAPLSLIFASVVWTRRQAYGLYWGSSQAAARRVPVVIMIVGNLYIGGTGKTPVVIELVRRLQARGWRPGVISRGYGTRVGNHARTGRGRIDPEQFGDEPALIASETDAPVSVHPNRALACRTLLKQFPDVNLVIADDGLQHLGLARDFELIVQDERGIGNGWVLPAGPLREPASRLSLADAVITRTPLKPGQSATQGAAHDPRIANTGVPHESAAFLTLSGFRRLSDGQTKDIPSFLAFTANKTVAAIAGIGTPSRFFKSLNDIGLQISFSQALPDHFSFKNNPFRAIQTDLVVLTSKDAVKCAAILDDRLWVAETSLTFSDPDFIVWLDHRLKILGARLNRD